MSEVSVRELRNNGGHVLDRVAAGEQVVITRDGQPVAELRQLGRPPLRAQQLLERWRHLPVLDRAQLRRDVDDAVAADL